MVPGADTYDLDITESGDFYVVYGRQADSELWATRSGDGGASWSDAVQVTTGESWTHSLRDKPYIESDDDKVYVIFQDQREVNPSLLWPTWYTSDAGANLSFGAPSEVDADPDNRWKHFPQIGIHPDGEVWIGWIEFGPNSTKQGYFARESNAFQSELITSQQTPCDCCQSNFLVTGGGDALLAWRSEWDDGGVTKRDPVVFIAWDDTTSFTDEVKMSTTSWELNQCPQQGVIITEGPDALYGTWADTTDGEYKVWLVKSDDGGLSWSSEVEVAPSLGAHNSPYLAVDDDDGVWVVLSELGPTYYVHSEDGGQNFADPVALQAPDGALLDPGVESNAGRTAIIGQSADTGKLWIYRP
jgi:hypothetical protein